VDERDGGLRIVLLGVATVLAGCGAGATGALPPFDGQALPGGDAGVACSILRTLADLAGPGARDCGYVRFGAASQTADDCAVSVFMAGQPFFVSYDRMGTDSHLVRGLVQESSGLLSVVDYDGDASGGGGDGNPTIDQRACDSPLVRATPGDRTLGDMPIDCDSVGSYMRLCP
jgi:hypothetical protein